MQSQRGTLLDSQGDPISNNNVAVLVASKHPQKSNLTSDLKPASLITLVLMCILPLTVDSDSCRNPRSNSHFDCFLGHGGLQMA